MLPETRSEEASNTSSPISVNSGHRCRTGERRQEDAILDAIEVYPIPTEGIDDTIDKMQEPPRDGETLGIGYVIVGGRQGRHHVSRTDLRRILLNPMTKLQQFAFYYLNQFVIKLDGSSRLGLLNQTALADLQRPAHGTLQVLFRDDAKRKRVRDIVKDALDFIFTVDPTNPGQVRARLNSREPSSADEERGLHKEAVIYHSTGIPIDQASDGVKAFAGIVAELIAGDPKVLLIDEPEAFLHPSIASRLGKELALATSGTDKKIFVSTHSPFFLMGCVQAGTSVNVIRLLVHPEVNDQT